jgi:uncharacterized phage-associated protein
MPHDARAVANFFLDYGSSKGVPVTIMTLLKVIFFAHAWHLAKTGEPLVGQPFEAWQYGPVNRVVYDQLKGQGSSAISERARVLNVETAAYEIAVLRDIQEDTLRLMRNVFDYYSQFDAFRLSKLTHIEGSPWDQVWNAATRRAVPGMVISDASIRDWFQRNRRTLGGVVAEGGENAENSNTSGTGVSTH